jgi:hypothetical protein
MTQAEIRSYGEQSVADIEKRTQRDEIRRQTGEKTRGREKMPKKESSGGRRARLCWAAFEEGKHGPCAGTCHLRSSESAGYQSKPIRPICASPRETPPLPSHPRKVVIPAHTARYDEPTSRVNLLWAARTTTSRKVGMRRIRKGLNARLRWPRSRVFVIIIAANLLLIYSPSHGSL